MSSGQWVAQDSAPPSCSSALKPEAQLRVAGQDAGAPGAGRTAWWEPDTPPRPYAGFSCRCLVGGRTSQTRVCHSLVPRLISRRGLGRARCSVCPAACSERPSAGRLGGSPLWPCCPPSPGHTRASALAGRAAVGARDSLPPQRGSQGLLGQGHSAFGAKGKRGVSRPSGDPEGECQERIPKFTASF